MNLRRRITRRHALQIVACVALAPLVLLSTRAQPGERQQSEYLYFSFITLTTLGLSASTPSVGLPLTALEALVGSVFLVTLVARLVTLWARQSGTD